MKFLARFLLLFSFSTLAHADAARDKILAAIEKIPHPNSASDFDSIPHLSALNQGKTLICWSFACSSFLESEMARLKKDPVRLSVFYPVYCAFLEKAKRFVRTKGASRFSAGDLFTGVSDAYREYGAMPASVYGPLEAGKVFDQNQLYSELDGLMASVKEKKNWDEAAVLSRVKEILHKHLGAPPQNFSFNKRNYTPRSFADEVIKLPWADYVMVTSFEYAPFHKFTELKVPDNWRHNSNYFNVPLDEFYAAFKRAAQSGFSIAVDVDNTEPSYRMTARHCLIPDFDRPAGGLTQAARELQFTSGATTDDHLIHVVGYKNFNGEDWFLAKDSWQKVWQSGNNGYVFLHESYVKLKVLAFFVHKDGVPAIKAFLKSPENRF